MYMNAGHSIDEVNIWEVNLGQDRISELYNNGEPVLFKKPSFNTYGLVSWFRFGDTLDENGETYASVDTSNVIYDRFGDDILSSTLTIQTDSHGSKTLLKNKYEAAINFPTASTIVGV